MFSRKVAYNRQEVINREGKTRHNKKEPARRGRVQDFFDTHTGRYAGQNQFPLGANRTHTKRIDRNDPGIRVGQLRSQRSIKKRCCRRK